MKQLRIALAGNPNAGKTSLFNILTGSNQYVGNWPGVTVEKKEGRLKGCPEVLIQDLPGIYSLSPYSPEELVTREYLVGDAPDVIVNILDGSNIERSLYLTTQLLELGRPVLVAVNMMELVRKRGDNIALNQLASALGCPCVEINARSGAGCQAAAERAMALESCCRPLPIFQGEVSRALEQIEKEIRNRVPLGCERWYALKLFEREEGIRQELNLSGETISRIESYIEKCEGIFSDDSPAIIANQRYQFIEVVVQGAVKKDSAPAHLSASERIDNIVTDRILALPIFAGVIFCMYAIALGNFPCSLGTIGTNWAGEVLFGKWVPKLLEQGLNAAHVSPWLKRLVLDGVVAGVGAVLSFVPQILVLSFLLSVLEDVGYMARVAFIMDRLFRKFGLSGKSIIPMLVATGCGVPGILASRTIEQERERKITVMTTGFVPCGAKMPMLGLFAGAMFGNSPLVAVSAFFIGGFAVVVSGCILKKFKGLAGEPSPFVMELPGYHLPSLGNVLRTTWERGWDYGRRAVTVVLLSSMILWLFQNYGIVNGVFQTVEDNNQSLLAAIGRGIAWLFHPLGWRGDMAWKAAVATVTGLAAKEQVVMAFGALYNYRGTLSESGSEIWARLAGDFGPARAYSFLTFNLLCAPCFAAVGAIRREMGSGAWTAITVGYMTAFAYGFSVLIFQFFGLLTGEATLGLETIMAMGVFAGGFYLAVRKTSGKGNAR